MMKSNESNTSVAERPVARPAFAAMSGADFGPTAQRHLSAADAAFQKGDMQSASSALEQAVASSPRSAPLIECLGNVLFQMGKHKEALTSFQQASKLDTKNAELQVRVAMAAVKCNQMKIFERSIERAFKLDPENTPAHRFLANLYMLEKNYPMASQHFVRVIQKDPDDLEALLVAGDCYLQLGNRKVGQYMFEQALCVDPANAVAAEKLNAMRIEDQLAEAAEAARRKSLPPPPKPAGTLESLIEDIKRDRIGRPHYAHGLLLATLQAMKIGVKEISVFEFGVLRGDGLLNLCDICRRITEDTGFKFKIYGFDSDVGMPPITDYRDHPEIWYTGQFKVDHDILRAKLPPNCELIVGDIAQTIIPFCRDKMTAECPVGFVAIDVDLYSSTVSSFHIFKQENPSLYLPAVVMYFDDVNDMITLNSWCGEALAIEEFNALPLLRKIEEKWTRQNTTNAGWHDQIYICHVLDHPVRSGKLKCASLDLNVTIY